MLGIPTQFEILKLTIAKLETSGDAVLNNIAQVMKDNSAYAHLGAMGPALADFLPADPLPAGEEYPEDYALIWKIVFGLIGGDLGLHATLEKIRTLMEQIQVIADNEDVDAICALKDTDFEEQITKASEDFASLVGVLESQALTITTIIGGGLKPKISTGGPHDPVPPANEWALRDFMSWKRTGQFVEKLIDKANDHEDNRLLAYAYGYLVSYSGCVCGSPFVNASVGGPPRTQWWRQRFVNNYVDAWVHGYYNMNPKPSFSGDVPTPGYEDWPSLCDAKLHEKISLAAIDPVALMNIVKTAQPFQQVLPNDFAEHWFEAFQETYDPPLPNGRFNANALNGSYLMSWLALWFQTSGEVIGCNLAEPMTPPDDCGDDPSALDPFVPAPGGGPTLPPAPEIDYDTDDALKVCGIIMAILGGLLLLGGGVAAGGALIGGAVSVLDCESLAIVNWKDLRCKLYWFRKYLYNGEKGLQHLMKFAGLMYPLSKDLAIDDDVLSVLGIDVPFESGKNLVKSRVDIPFPSKCWDGSLLTFNQRPTFSNPGFETPSTLACLNAIYPDFFVDNTADNPLSNGDIKTPPATFPDRKQTNGMPIQFGNAVDNAVDLFENLGAGIPDWNLDADRGLAYVTWQFKGPYDPDNVQIQPEP